MMDDDLCYLSKTEAQIWITIAFILGMVIISVAQTDETFDILLDYSCSAGLAIT